QSRPAAAGRPARARRAGELGTGPADGILPVLLVGPVPRATPRAARRQRYPRLPAVAQRPRALQSAGGPASTIAAALLSRQAQFRSTRISQDEAPPLDRRAGAGYT